MFFLAIFKCFNFFIYSHLIVNFVSGSVKWYMGFVTKEDFFYKCVLVLGFLPIKFPFKYFIIFLFGWLFLKLACRISFCNLDIDPFSVKYVTNIFSRFVVSVLTLFCGVLMNWHFQFWLCSIHLLIPSIPRSWKKLA